MGTIRIPKITKSARDKDCTLRLPGACNHNPETTVWAHSNHIEDGKGGSTKADDIFGCYACSSCHDELDGRTHVTGLTKEEIDWYFHRAMKESWRILILTGVLK